MDERLVAAGASEEEEREVAAAAAFIPDAAVVVGFAAVMYAAGSCPVLSPKNVIGSC